MEYITIDAHSARYMSELEEFQEGLPHGILNKTKTDVGGTYVAANCPSNYIIVVPYRDLADSIERDSNNRYPIFKCYGGIKERDFRNYLQISTAPYKTVVTYDSFSRLTDWINDTSGWKLLIDEYHSLLEDMDFREDAINKLITTLKRYNHYTFLSATPIDDEYEIELFKNLPHYRVIWDGLMKVNVMRYKCSNVTSGLARLIKIFRTEGLEGQTIDGDIQQVRELYIFLNSVTSIEQICRSLELPKDEVKICCAGTNRNRLLLKNYPIESVSAPNKRINFFTRKCFQGCNLFTDNGLVIVGSDCFKRYTMVDISSTMEQIAGRIRCNEKHQNIFRNSLIHIYSTNSKIETEESFEEEMKRLHDDAINIISSFDKLNDKERKALIDRINISNDIVSIEGNTMSINENKIKSFYHKHRLRMEYNNGLTIHAAYSKSSKFIPSEQTDWHGLDTKLKHALTISYQELLKDYMEHPSESYENEYPEFSLFRQHLTLQEMNTLRWNKVKMQERVDYYRMLDRIFRNIHHKGFYTVPQIEKMLNDEASRLGYGKPLKASVIKRCTMYEVTAKKKVINGKECRGYEIGGLKFAFQPTVQ